MKNYLKVSLLCITTLTLYGGEHRKSGGRDLPQKSASFSGTPNPKTPINQLSKSSPIPIQISKEGHVHLGNQPKTPSKGNSFSDYVFGFDDQGCSPHPYSYYDSSR